ncbi:MAG: hypothetical protein ACOH5I_03270 [Oligoflexus sp.]
MKIFISVITLLLASQSFAQKGLFTPTKFGFEHTFFQGDFGTQFGSYLNVHPFDYSPEPNRFNLAQNGNFFAFGPYVSYPKSGEYGFSFKFKGLFLTGIHHDTSCKKRNAFRQCTARHDRWYPGTMLFDVTTGGGTQVLYQERLSSEDIRIRNNFPVHPSGIPTGVPVTDMGNGRFFSVHSQRIQGPINQLEMRISQASSGTYLYLDFEGSKVIYLDL